MQRRDTHGKDRAAVGDISEHSSLCDARPQGRAALPEPSAAQAILPPAGAARLVHRDGEVALPHVGMEAVARRHPGREESTPACTVAGTVCYLSGRDRRLNQESDNMYSRN
jgi:hypothetical protein